jgi:hypothetical protein
VLRELDRSDLAQNVWGEALGASQGCRLAEPSCVICDDLRKRRTDKQAKSKRIQMKLQSKTALITGGNSGIKLATAQLFIAEGARVAITGRNQKTLDAAAKGLGPNALPFNAGGLSGTMLGGQAIKAGIDATRDGQRSGH